MTSTRNKHDQLSWSTSENNWSTSLDADLSKSSFGRPERQIGRPVWQSVQPKNQNWSTSDSHRSTSPDSNLGGHTELVDQRPRLVDQMYFKNLSRPYDWSTRIGHWSTNETEQKLGFWRVAGGRPVDSIGRPVHKRNYIHVLIGRPAKQVGRPENHLNLKLVDQYWKLVDQKPYHFFKRFLVTFLPKFCGDLFMKLVLHHPVDS